MAVLEAELEKGMAEILDAPDTDTTGRLLLVVPRLEQARRLVANVHARVPISPVIAAWHDRFHELSETLVQGDVQQAGIATKKAKALVKLCVFKTEGLLAHPMSDDEKRQICSFLTKNLTTA